MFGYRLINELLNELINESITWMIYRDAVESKNSGMAIIKHEHVF